jgi:general secretion pathway protein G
MQLKEWNRNAPRRRAIGRRGARGFTLVELLLVLIILALIGGLVLPNIIGRAEGAKVRAASSQIDRLSMAVETYYMDTNAFPDTLDELVDNNGGVAGWNGPYVKRSILKDPWNREYVYAYPGEKGQFDITSLGADGQPGGEETNADINNWD